MLMATEAAAIVWANERKVDACAKGMQQWCNLEFRPVIRHG